VGAHFVPFGLPTDAIQVPRSHILKTTGLFLDIQLAILDFSSNIVGYTGTRKTWHLTEACELSYRRKKRGGGDKSRALAFQGFEDHETGYPAFTLLIRDSIEEHRGKETHG